MPDRSPDSTPRSDAREAGSNALPGLAEQVQSIRSLWAFQREHWKPETTGELHEQLSRLAEQAEQAGTSELAETAFCAEVYLSSFVGMEVPMTPEQREHFDGLLAALDVPLPPLEQQPHDIEPPTSAQPEFPSPSICVLPPLPQAFAAVVSQLGESGLSIRRVDDPTEAIHLLHRRQASAVLVDVASIPSMEPLIEELARIHKNTGRRIPVIYVAENGDLETRIRATRAGGSAFFSPPFDIRDIRERIAVLLGTQAPRAPYRVVVVEDDLAQAKFAASVLSKAGIKVRIVTDPMQILDQLHGFRPDLILMDIYMPGVNGIELTSVIREYNEFVNIPIVFLSGEQDTDKQVDALSVGGDDFITKPIRPRQLIAVVENRIRRSQMLFGNGPGPQHGHCTLTQTQFLDRIAAQLSIDPMRSQTHALLLLQLDQMHKLEGQADLITELAEVVARELGSNDALARLDHETLGILVRRSNTNPIHDLCSRLHEAVAQHTFTLCDKQTTPTIAIGMALAQKSGNEALEMISRARLALQHALANGPGKTVTHDESLEEQLAATNESAVAARNEITQVLREGLANDEIRLFYQPMLDLVDPGTEAWEIQPHLPTTTGELLPLRELRKEIERTGLADQVDTWLLGKGLDILKQRRNDAHKIHLFIPQSAISLYNPDYPDWVSEELRNRRMVGTGLVLQFRLSALSHDLKAAKQAISQLREMDIRVCLSRFAEKPAAFKVLRHVRGNFIRIAPRLLRADKETITTVIREAHRLNARVVVSNIDDPRAIDLHWSSGADLLQGDFIQQAMDTMEYDFTQVVI